MLKTLAIVEQVSNVRILINNRVTDAVADQNLHFFKSAEGPFSRDADHILSESIESIATCSGNLGQTNFPSGLSSDGTTGLAIQMHPYPIACCGVIESWVASYDGVPAGGQDIVFQVWRPTTGSSYTLVGQNTFTITGDGTTTSTVAVGNRIQVVSGDIWGWWTSGTDIIRFKDNGNRADNNQLLVLSSLAVGATQDWSGATTQNDRDYSAYLTYSTGSGPSFTNLPSDTTISNDSPSGQTLTTVTVTNVDTGDASSLTTTMTTATSEFSFDPSTLVLTTGTLTTSSGPVYLDFEVSDSCETATATYTVTIYNPPPVIHNTPSSANVREDVTSENLLITVNATDSKDTVTCTTSTGFDTTNFDFKLIPGSTYYGIYNKASHTFDYNTVNSYTLPVDCTDGDTTVSGSYFVYIIQNEPPVITNLQNSTSLTTQAAIGTTVFTVISTDAENDNLNYTMTCTPTGCPFEIKADGQVQLNADVTTSAIVGYDLFISVSDGKSTTGPSTLTVTFSDINDAVVISNLPLGSSLPVPENTALSTAVYNVTFSDNDATQSHTWTMTSNPSSGLTYFSIGSTGVISTDGTVINYEAMGATTLTFSVTVADPVTSDTQDLVIEIVNVNENPAFAQASYGLSTTEGTAGTVLGTPSFGVTDPDGDTTSLSLDCGSTSSYFLMNSTTGAVSFQTDYDLDLGTLASTVVCTVTATDPEGLTATTSLTINIADINDNTPAFVPDAYSFYVSYYSDTGTQVGATTASDGDSGTFGTLLYSLDQTSLGVQQFSVDGNGVIYVQVAPDGGSSGVNYSSSYTLTLTATDGGGLTDTATVQIVISDTTTAAPTTTTDRYKTFFESPENWGWFVPCMILLFAAIAVSTWVVYTCKGKYGCTAFLNNLKQALRIRTRGGRMRSFGYTRHNNKMMSVRHYPPPAGLQQWRNKMRV